jgi:hypothetical protein
MAEKLIITLDELNSPRVDAKLREHQLVSRTQEHYEQASLPAATAPRRQWTFLYNTFFYMGVFGLLGGLLGWAGGEVMHLRPNARMEVRELIAAEEEIHAARRIQRLTDAEAEIALQEMRRGARQNPYYAIHIDSTLSPAEKQARWAEIARRDEWKEYLANVLFYGMCGMMIAACLSAAERIIDRNWAGAALYASAGAVAGLAGGLIVSLFVDRLYDAILGGPAGQASLLWQTLARTAAWAVLGLFLGSAPGIVLRNRRRQSPR